MLILIEVTVLGFMMGLSGAIIPGPVVAFVTQQSLINGFRSAVIATIGHAMVGAATLVLVLATGITTVFGSSLFQLYAGLVGGLSLGVLGLGILRSSLKHPPPVQLNAPHSSYHSPFIGGIIVTVANPSFFLWWAVIGLPTLGIASDLAGVPGIYCWTTGIIVSILLWYGGIAWIIARGRDHLPRRMHIAISVACAMFLILSGCYILAKYVFNLI
jgi:threonine/homoserine/homoserine lactone efflux protein